MKITLRTALVLALGASTVFTTGGVALATVGSSSPPTSGLSLCVGDTGAVTAAASDGGACPRGRSLTVVAHQQSAVDAFARIAALEQQVEKQQEALDAASARIEQLEWLFVGVSRDGDTLRFSGMNVQIVNGRGSTETTNGLGNLIVGYNLLRAGGGDARTGSHNVVVGDSQNFTRFGGIVAGFRNEISGDWSSVTGGQFNTAGGVGASVTGGFGNLARAPWAAVTGGRDNIARGRDSSVSGGFSRIVHGDFDWSAGSLFQDD